MPEKRRNQKVIVITALVTCILTMVVCSVVAMYFGMGFRAVLARNYILHGTINPEVTKKSLEDAAIRGMIESVGDPYSTYLDEKQYNAVLSDMTEEQFVGIGVSIAKEQDGRLVVAMVSAGSPAEEAGVRPEDELLKINGESINIENYDQMIESVAKGKEGDIVHMTFCHKGETAPFEAAITLRNLERDNIACEMLTEQVGYIRILQFDPNVNQQFQAALDDLLAQNMQGMILDVRHNPGGLVEEVVPIIDRLVPEGTIATVQDKNGTVLQSYSSDETAVDMPMYILTDEGTASASELLTGVLTDLGRAESIGTKTYGKAIGQGLYPLGGGTGIYLTNSKFFLPSGVSIHGVGILPDYQVALEEGQNVFTLPKEEDPHIQKALALLAEKLG